MKISEGVLYEDQILPFYSDWSHTLTYYRVHVVWWKEMFEHTIMLIRSRKWMKHRKGRQTMINNTLHRKLMIETQRQSNMWSSVTQIFCNSRPNHNDYHKISVVTSTWPLWIIYSVASLIAAIFYSVIPGKEDKIWHIYKQRYLVHMQALLECCYI